MPFTHVDVLNNPIETRRALIATFAFFIHVSPSKNIGSIREKGLIANRDATPDPDILKATGGAEHLLCLYPFGARRTPEGTGDPPFMTFAIIGEHLPHNVGLDWSYYPRLSSPPPIVGNTLVHWVSYNAHEYGSVVSYERIPPERLRVFCHKSGPANPLSWPLLQTVTDDKIYKHA